MNDGFIAFWLLSMAFILYVTGWKEQVAEGMSSRMLGLFILGALLLHVAELTVKESVLITGSAALAIAVAFIQLAMLRHFGTVLFVVFSALLTGFMWMWVRYIYGMDPVFIVLNPAWDGPLLAGLFAGLLADRFRSQFVIAVFAAVFSQLDLLISPLVITKLMMIGSPAWWDGLVIALTAARVTGNVKNWVKQKAVRFVEGRTGERGGNV
ncbi:hypothetical protein [Paenibacillus sp. CF384]|uniref:YphA family membrane protein n=1 Tax=Paenibacillus sp. CF384 TaxID=1884382 RepID=UPI00089D76F0|nr:hypothetical protein [Paenibacillus sp. CF384]SDW31153.1 hypothetical protein SAMN05518855_10011036 [Paenibacillus sp. CF384]